MTHDRRSVLAAIGLALPFGLKARVGASPAPAGPPPELTFRPFEEAVREAFRTAPLPAAGAVNAFLFRRIEVGHSDAVQAGIQGCHNDRPFAGFPAGHLRIVRTASGPGPAFRGVRLYVTAVDVVLAGDSTDGGPSRPLDFATLPPAPTLSGGEPDRAEAPRSLVGV